MARVAALDLGSNTTLLLVAEVSESARGGSPGPGAIEAVLHDETTVTRLGQGVHHNRVFHPEALQRMDACLARYSDTIKNLKCDHVVAVATSAARDVSNGHLLLEIGAKYGIPIHIISGQKEAELTLAGACSDVPSTDGIAVIDVGGGSTEVITGQSVASGERQVIGSSVNVGSVRLTELFVKNDPVKSSEAAEMKTYIETALSKSVLPKGPFRRVVAVAGTPTTLACLEQQVAFSESKVHGFKLTRTMINDWISKLSQLSLSERESLPGMQAKRADVIFAGAMILQNVMLSLQVDQVDVSTRGVRYGVATHWSTFQP